MKKQLTVAQRLTTAQRVASHGDCPICRGAKEHANGDKCQYWGGGGIGKEVDPVEVTPLPARGDYRHSEF